MANEVVWISRGQGLAGFFLKILVEKIVRWLRKKRYFCGAKGDNSSLVGRCDLVLVPILRDQAEKWGARKGCGISS